MASSEYPACSCASAAMAPNIQFHANSVARATVLSRSTSLASETNCLLLKLLCNQIADTELRRCDSWRGRGWKMSDQPQTIQLSRDQIAGHIADRLRDNLQSMREQFSAPDQISSCWVDDLLPEPLARKSMRPFHPLVG
jgi:hypothetical protein